MHHSNRACGNIGNNNATEICPKAMKYPTCLGNTFKRKMRIPKIISANNKGTNTIIANVRCKKYEMSTLKIPTKKKETVMNSKRANPNIERTL